MHHQAAAVEAELKLARIAGCDRVREALLEDRGDAADEGWQVGYADVEGILPKRPHAVADDAIDRVLGAEREGKYFERLVVTPAGRQGGAALGQIAQHGWRRVQPGCTAPQLDA